MSPRRNSRRRDDKGLDENRARGGVEFVHADSDGEWSVRHVSVDAAVKIYRCPGCDQEIRVGVPHVVAWPADGRGDASDRRHWHTGCWQARGRRNPTRRIGR
ncbi:hypothetical protein F4553_005505 [Allocatelliglobosispora scoriae]|uniref:ATP/GTP-binding protein n=1 Tax=Allocatelliglobosispora scoriae TaxID=643052 RepID=A0A841BZI7_9ACTN|nr:hypothetical protein [Allocatelliglobosispora scoriae]